MRPKTFFVLDGLRRFWPVRIIAWLWDVGQVYLSNFSVLQSPDGAPCEVEDTLDDLKSAP